MSEGATKPVGRRQARRQALFLLYQWDLTGQPLASLYEGTPVGVELPKSVVLAVIEADAVVKGQTASSSYKPAVVEGGIKVMVPPHIAVGTRLVINTEDGAYMERAKD